MYLTGFQKEDGGDATASCNVPYRISSASEMERNEHVFSDFHDVSELALIPNIRRQIDLASSDSEAEGFKPANPSSYEQMQRFLNTLPSSYRFEEPVAALGPDGSIGLLWENGSVYVYLDFRTDNRLHYYARDENKQSVEAVLSALADHGIVYSHIIPLIGHPVFNRAMFVFSRDEGTASQIASVLVVIQAQGVAQSAFVINPNQENRKSLFTAWIS